MSLMFVPFIIIRSKNSHHMHCIWWAHSSISFSNWYLKYLTLIYSATPVSYVHKHTHFGFYPHVYSATVLPYAIAFSILLFYHLVYICYIIHSYHILTHCIFCCYCVILMDCISRCYYVIQSVLLYTGCFTHYFFYPLYILDIPPVRSEFPVT
jgi:hypothetical protein